MQGSSVLPQADFTYALGNNHASLSGLQETVETEKAETEDASSNISKSTAEAADSDETVTNVTPLASTVTDSILSDIQSATGAIIKNSEIAKEVEEDSDKRHERAAKQPGTSTLIALGCHMPPGLHFYSLYPKGDGSCIGVQIRFFLTRNQCDITMVSANEGTLVRGTWGIWPVEWPPKAQERNVR